MGRPQPRHVQEALAGEGDGLAGVRDVQDEAGPRGHVVVHRRQRTICLVYDSEQLHHITYYNVLLYIYIIHYLYLCIIILLYILNINYMSTEYGNDHIHLLSRLNIIYVLYFKNTNISLHLDVANSGPIWQLPSGKVTGA